MAKAIVRTESVQAMFKRARALASRADADKRLPEANFHLSFVDGGQLLAEFTPARLRLLKTLNAAGPVSIYALAKRLKRNYSNVHRDVVRLMGLGMVAKDKTGRVFVPWADIQIRMSLRDVA